ncbi:MAG TPA: START-like domain-containing protein [Chitinophagaceae bacterium]|nr:START-like domain-containing protein [Chitinophagaceae bacterium]
MDKKLITIEIPINCSPNILYGFLSTASGLQEWFADKVEQHGDSFFFTWDGSTDEAFRIDSVENEMIKYKWDYMDEGEYFQFTIEQSIITNETILIITDFVDDYEEKDQRRLWESQIDDLKLRIGS